MSSYRTIRRIKAKVRLYREKPFFWAAGLAVGLVVLCLIGFAAGCRKAKVINLSFIQGEDSTWQQGAKRWGELLDQRAQGHFRLNLIPNAAFSAHNQKTELEMVQKGQLQAALEPTLVLTSVDRRFMVFSLPWLFQNYLVAETVLEGTPGQQMLANLADNRLIGLAYGSNGFRNLTNSRKRIEKTNDLRELKIRVPAVRLFDDFYRMFSATGVQLNAGELYAALRDKTVDGQDGSLATIWNSKFYEVQSYLTYWNSMYDPLVLCVNRQFWESLPVREQVVLRDTAREAMLYQRGLARQEEKAALEKLRAQGMDIASPQGVDWQSFYAAGSYVRNQYRSVIGPEVVDWFSKAADQAEIDQGLPLMEDAPGAPAP